VIQLVADLAAEIFVQKNLYCHISETDSVTRSRAPLPL
jgi:hypothetical protein